MIANGYGEPLTVVQAARALQTIMAAIHLILFLYLWLHHEGGSRSHDIVP